MDRFSAFTKNERKLIIFGLIEHCKSFLDYGLNGFNKVGKREYNKTLSLLKEADNEKEYEHIYRNWKII